jgi:hypothetical protein
MSALRNLLTLIFGAAFVIGTLALGLLILTLQLDGADDLLADLRCVAGIPADDGAACVQDSIAAANEARERAESALLGQSIVYEQGAHIGDGVSLVVSSIYADASTRSGLISSFCYAILDNGGLDPRVALATRSGDGRVTAQVISVRDLAMLRMEADALNAARDQCPWPDA